MTRYLFVLLLFLIGQQLLGQKVEILKGASKFREIVFKEYGGSLQRIELIRERLDSLGVDNESFLVFCQTLSRLAYTLRGDGHGIEILTSALKDHEVYMSLSDAEVNFILDNLELIFISRFQIWADRYPHKLNTHALRFEEMASYDVRQGERLLYFFPFNSRLCEILYLGMDGVHVDLHTGTEVMQNGGLSRIILDGKFNPKSRFGTVREKFPTPNEAVLYDKVVFDCLGKLFYSRFPEFKDCMKTIRNLLKPEGEFIASVNFESNTTFDGVGRGIEEMDKKVERILRQGFEIKERIYSEGKFVTYKFCRAND